MIKKSRSSSAPSPLDRISYLVLNKCSSLHPALLHLFNRVIMEGTVPSAWKLAAVKLIPKGAAEEDPSTPGNFRPIALTPSISKLLSGILKERWLRHMCANKYLNPNLQKAFLPTIPGVTEHQAKLASIIRTANRSKRSLAIAWLDIANAYGSVPHALIQFSLAHYHAPPEFCRLLQSWYTGLSATISSSKWLKIGVYQGDPLSVVIFQTVMNTLSDTLCSRSDLGFTLPLSSTSVNHLLYADDACIVSNTPAGCQHLLSMVERWLEWAKLKAKVPKYRSLVIQASTGKRITTNLSIGGQTIPPVEDDDTFKFLGMPVRVTRNNDVARVSIQGNLRWMLDVIDTAPLTRQQKLRLYRYGVCPRLSWPLTVEDLPISWLERELQPLVTKAPSRSGLVWQGHPTPPSNTSILFLSAKRGGLAIPSLVDLHKKMHATRMVQLVTSSDPVVRKAAELHLEEERRVQRRKFLPAQLVEDLMSGGLSQSRRTVSRAAKTIIAEEEGDKRHQDLCKLPAQGEMARSWEESSPDLWVKAVQGLPPEPLKFALNASLNTLPTNAVLHTWGKKPGDTCTLPPAVPSPRSKQLPGRYGSPKVQ